MGAAEGKCSVRGLGAGAFRCAQHAACSEQLEGSGHFGGAAAGKRRAWRR
jgi:hypothetical protein